MAWQSVRHDSPQILRPALKLFIRLPQTQSERRRGLFFIWGAQVAIR